MGESMIVRKLLTVSFSAAVFMSAFAVSDAFAAPKKPGGVGICITKPQPECNLFLKAVCTKKSRCGGCLQWACKP
jgi:hypothetical protein